MELPKPTPEYEPIEWMAELLRAIVREFLLVLDVVTEKIGRTPDWMLDTLLTLALLASLAAFVVVVL